jgi:hypothetical protein
MPIPFPYLLLASVILCYIVMAVRSQRSSVRLNHRTWAQLVAGLQAIDSEGVCVVARDYLQPKIGQIELEPSSMWTLLGGHTGLRRMRDNADNMIALAAFAQQWNLEESVVVAERMRRDGLRLRRAVTRIEFGMKMQLILGRHLVSVPFQIQEAASAYYLMRERLLALYQSSHAGLYPKLASAL